MKICIAYSSRTGNTRRMAEGLAQELRELGPVLVDLNALPAGAALPEAEVYLIGYWVRRGAPDVTAARFIQSLRNARAGLFGTLGAYPYSAHGRRAAQAAEALLSDTCEHLGTFQCQGALAEDVLRRSRARKGEPSEETKRRHRIAAGHPNAEDWHFAAGLFRERF